METADDLIAPFKLEIKDLGDRRREITYETGPEDTRNPVTTLWTRKRYFTYKETVYKNVYLDESTAGQLRVVKEILHQDPTRGNRCLELEAAARIAKDLGPSYTRLFVEFLGWFEIPNGVSLVLEYCALGDIDQFFQKPVSEQVAKTVAGQLLEGLASLHGLGIAHRDIKPQVCTSLSGKPVADVSENVLVAEADPIAVKIADFGVSKYTADRTSLRSRVGTPEYMAPELLFGTNEESKYTNAVDIWSLGCLLFYLLTNSHPFPGFRELDEYYQGNLPYPDAPLTEQGVGSSGRCFIQHLMSPIPDDRPPASKYLLSEWEIGINDEPIKQPSLETAEPEFTQDIDAPPGLSMTETHWNSAPSISQLPMDYWSSELLFTTSQPANGTSTTTRRTRALLESGADPNRMQNGHTALHHAARQGCPETVRLLLEYGADTWIRTRTQQGHDYDYDYDYEGETALHLSTHRGDSQAFLDILHLLVARGVDVNAQDGMGNTVLHLAIARLASAEPVHALLDSGARTDLLGRGGLTPLQYALSLDREEKARVLLVAGGADPNIPSPDGRRPLHRAIESGRVSFELVRQLVDSDADVDATDDDGCSPLYEAVRRDRADVVHFLIDRGADTALGSVTMEKRLQWMQFRRELPWPLRK